MRKVKWVEVFVVALVTLGVSGVGIPVAHAAAIVLRSVSTGSTSSSSSRDRGYDSGPGRNLLQARY